MLKERIYITLNALPWAFVLPALYQHCFFCHLFYCCWAVYVALTPRVPVPTRVPSRTAAFIAISANSYIVRILFVVLVNVRRRRGAAARGSLHHYVICNTTPLILPGLSDGETLSCHTDTFGGRWYGRIYFFFLL
jgi:hypothetical protein